VLTVEASQRLQNTDVVVLPWGSDLAKSLSSCLIQIPITHAFHAVANRDDHIGRGDLADRTNKY